MNILAKFKPQSAMRFVRPFSTSYENVLFEKKEGNVALVQLNRPKALNALCDALYKDLYDCLSELD